MKSKEEQIEREFDKLIPSELRQQAEIPKTFIGGIHKVNSEILSCNRKVYKLKEILSVIRKSGCFGYYPKPEAERTKNLLQKLLVSLKELYTEIQKSIEELKENEKNNKKKRLYL